MIRVVACVDARRCASADCARKADVVLVEPDRAYCTFCVGTWLLLYVKPRATVKPRGTRVEAPDYFCGAAYCDDPACTQEHVQ